MSTVYPGTQNNKTNLSVLERSICKFGPKPPVFILLDFTPKSSKMKTGGFEPVHNRTGPKIKIKIIANNDNSLDLNFTSQITSIYRSCHDHVVDCLTGSSYQL